MLCYKLNKDSSISMCKFRPVAQDFTQQEGTNFNKTFSLRVKLTAVRIIAAIVVRNDWELEKMDVDAAYLNPSFKEDIYMCQPRGFEAPGEEDKVIHLKMAIYGLRKSAREWYEGLMDTLTKFGFKRCRVEHAVFYRFNQDMIILVVDVDNMTITRNSHREMQRFKDKLSSRYCIKDMGNLCYLLGIRIDSGCKNRTISFSQATYIQKIVEHFRMEDINPLSIPITPSHNLTKSQSPVSDSDIEEMRNIPYREAVSSLIYVVIGM